MTLMKNEPPIPEKDEYSRMRINEDDIKHLALTYQKNLAQLRLTTLRKKQEINTGKI